MASEWTETTLADVSSDVAYGYTESATLERVGPRFLRITDIQNGVVDWSDVPFCPISQEDHHKYRLQHGDIVVARTGNSTGENYLFRGNEDAVFASYLIRFRIDDSRADPAFVWYHLRSAAWWGFINGAKTGSAQAGANAKVLGTFPLALPPLPEQKRIAHILGTLDDKIELNRRMNATLEGISRAIFKSWFVDFDPVRQKASGKQPVGIDAQTAALFPDSFEDSEIGEVPKGWKTIALYDTATFINGAAFADQHFCPRYEGLPVVKIAELKNGISEQTKFSARSDLDPKYRIDTGTLLYSWSGSPDTSLDVFLWSLGPGLLNQHIFRVETLSEAHKRFAYYLLKHLRPTLVEIARNKQTTGLGHVTVADMRRLKIAFPSPNVLQAFDKEVEPLFEKSFLNTLESKSLAALRDTLLPKLLSGEVRIAEAKEAVEEAIG